VSQVAALASLVGPQDVFQGFKAELEKRRNLICERLDETGGRFSHIRPAGAFYVMARADGLFRDETPPDSRQLAIRLIREAHVITIPGGAFGPGGEGHLRLSFGGDEAEIEEACKRLTQWSAQI